MEPFGLLQFLQTLLSQPQATPAESPKDPAPSEEQAPPAKEEKSAAHDEVKTPSQEAYLQFLANHEARTRRTKKK